MPTFTGQIKNNQIIFVSAVSMPKAGVSNAKYYNCLLDTGAQKTLISEKVAVEVALTPIGTADIIPASGEVVTTNKYRIRLDIPVSSETVFPGGVVKPDIAYRGKDMDVAQLPYQPNNYDILLGMDFISAIHLTLNGQVYILSI